MTSVTTALSLVSNFDRVPQDVLKEAARIGTETHRYALAAMQGFDLQPPEDIEPFVEKTLRWFELHVEEVVHAEVEVIHPDFRYIGHCDLVAVLKREKRPCVIDLKRVATVQPTTGMQLAAYLEAGQRTFKEKYGRRFALHIPRDGECRAVEFKNPNDFPAFLAALTLYNHLNKEGATR